LPKTLALIHTAPVLIPVFSDLAARILGNTRVFHIADESLLKNTIAVGRIEKGTIRRVCRYIESAREAGADAVLVTCSSIGAAIPVARQLFDFPVLRVDERMAETAVRAAGPIGVLATLPTTLEPTIALIRDAAARLGRSPEIVSSLCEGAFAAVSAGDTATHDRIVTAGLETLAASCGVVVLAQASMARVADALDPAPRRAPILSSPRLAMEQVRDVLESLP